MLFWAQMSFAPRQEEKSVELPKGYKLEATGNNLLLKRPNGFLIAAFGEGMAMDSILRVAEADERYLRAVERQERMLGKPAQSFSQPWRRPTGRERRSPQRPLALAVARRDVSRTAHQLTRIYAWG
jgi:hypothetical protein